MGYAVPAAAVLCMELVDPSPISPRTEGFNVAGESYSRSAIIQQLSILVCYLNSLGFSGPNSPIISNPESVIRKVLNHVLNASGEPRTVQEVGNFEFTPDWGNLAQFTPLDNIDWFN
jgi:hypothetical protein